MSACIMLLVFLAMTLLLSYCIVYICIVSVLLPLSLEVVLIKFGVTATFGHRLLFTLACPPRLSFLSIKQPHKSFLFDALLSLFLSVLLPNCFHSQACQNGNSQHLEHLLFYGADSSSQNASGNTALHICALYNKVFHRVQIKYRLPPTVPKFDAMIFKTVFLKKINLLLFSSTN